MSRTHPTIIRKFVWWWRDQEEAAKNAICFTLLFIMVFAIKGALYLLWLIFRFLGLSN